MGEIAGTYRVLQAAGTRLGTQAPGGVSTLEPGQKLPALREKQLQVGVKLLDGTVEAFNVEVSCVAGGQVSADLGEFLGDSQPAWPWSPSCGMEPPPMSWLCSGSPWDWSRRFQQNCGQQKHLKSPPVVNSLGDVQGGCTRSMSFFF